MPNTRVGRVLLAASLLLPLALSYAQDPSSQTPCFNANPERCRILDLQRKLIAAMKSGRNEEALRILKDLPEVNFFLDDAGTMTPLSLAVKNGDRELVAGLLANGADPLARARNGVILLDTAINASRLEAKRYRPEMIECVRLALDKAKTSGRLQGSPMDASVAFHFGWDEKYFSLELLEVLFRYGTDPERPPINSRNPPLDLAFRFNDLDAIRLVTAATIKNGHAEVVDARAYRAFVEGRARALEALKSGGADPARHVKRNERDALFEAMQRERSADVLGFVLAQGVNPNMQRTANLRTFAIFSALSSPEKLRLLLKAGADANAKDVSAYTPLAYVLFDQTVDPKRKLLVIQMLLDAGANLNADNGGRGKWGALGLARREEKETIEFLLDRGATLTDNERGPISIALDLDRDDLAVALLRRNPKVDAKDRLALVSATRRGYSELAQALVRAGADPNAADASGLTALGVAERRRDRALAGALIAAGAKSSPQTLRPKVNAWDHFGAAAAAEIDEVVFFDPPRFALVGSNEAAVFALYGKEFNQFEQVKCERSASFGIIANAGMAGNIVVGACQAESKHLQELASAAETSMNRMFAALMQGSPTSTGDKERLRKAGWVYEKKQGPDRSEVQYFPVIAVGHGILGVSTVVLFSEKRRQAIVIQADVMQLCGEGHRMQTPLCSDTKDALVDIAQRIYARLADKP